MRALRSGLLIAACLVTMTRTGSATSAREILDRARQLDDTTRHWTDRTQKLLLVIHDTNGGERRRDIQILTKRFAGGEQKTISFFGAPPEVRGTAFLQWEYRGRDADQWLYLPEFKRTRQIAMRLRDESFAATDFTYRDLEIVGRFLQWTDAEAPSTLMGEASVGDHACYTIELRPQQDGSPYGRLQLWLDKQALVPRQLDFTGRDGTWLKSLGFDDIREVGAIPTPYRLDMRNVVKGSRTSVEVTDVRYNTGLGDDVFTERSLERGAP